MSSSNKMGDEVEPVVSTRQEVVPSSPRFNKPRSLSKPFADLSPDSFESLTVPSIGDYTTHETDSKTGDERSIFLGDVSTQISLHERPSLLLNHFHSPFFSDSCLDDSSRSTTDLQRFSHQ